MGAKLYHYTLEWKIQLTIQNNIKVSFIDKYDLYTANDSISIDRHIVTYQDLYLLISKKVKESHHALGQRMAERPVKRAIMPNGRE